MPATSQAGNWRPARRVVPAPPGAAIPVPPGAPPEVPPPVASGVCERAGSARLGTVVGLRLGWGMPGHHEASVKKLIPIISMGIGLYREPDRLAGEDTVTGASRRLAVVERAELRGECRIGGAVRRHHRIYV